MKLILWVWADTWAIWDFMDSRYPGQAVEDPKTVSQNALDLVSVYPMRLHLSTLSGKRTNFYTYLATAQKTKYAMVPVHTEEEFTCSIHLYHQMVSLTLKEWQPGGQLKQMERIYIFKMHKHLENHYTKQTKKKQEKENLINRLSQRKKNQERIQASTYVALVLDPFQFFDNDLTMNQPNQLPPKIKKGKKILA